MRYGNSWSTIARALHISESSIKNAWHSCGRVKNPSATKHRVLWEYTSRVAAGAPPAAALAAAQAAAQAAMGAAIAVPPLPMAATMPLQAPGSGAAATLSLPHVPAAASLRQVSAAAANSQQQSAPPIAPALVLPHSQPLDRHSTPAAPQPQQPAAPFLRTSSPSLQAQQPSSGASAPLLQPAAAASPLQPAAALLALLSQLMSQGPRNAAEGELLSRLLSACEIRLRSSGRAAPKLADACSATDVAPSGDSVESEQRGISAPAAEHPPVSPEHAEIAGLSHRESGHGSSHIDVPALCDGDLIATGRAAAVDADILPKVPAAASAKLVSAAVGGKRQFKAAASDSGSGTDEQYSATERLLMRWNGGSKAFGSVDPAAKRQCV